jgi:hypothetical protein
MPGTANISNVYYSRIAKKESFPKRGCLTESGTGTYTDFQAGLREWKQGRREKQPESTHCCSQFAGGGRKGGNARWPAWGRTESRGAILSNKENSRPQLAVCTLLESFIIKSTWSDRQTATCSHRYIALDRAQCAPSSNGFLLVLGRLRCWFWKERKKANDIGEKCGK